MCYQLKKDFLKSDVFKSYHSILIQVLIPRLPKMAENSNNKNTHQNYKTSHTQIYQSLQSIDKLEFFSLTPKLKKPKVSSGYLQDIS